MKTKKTILCLIFAVLFFSFLSEAIADFYHQTINFDKENLKFGKVNGYDFVSINQEKDIELSQEIGNPQLPFKIARLYLPQGKEISQITIIAKESEYLDGEFSIYPAQPPQILSKSENEIDFIQPTKGIYESSKVYPERIVKIAKQGYFAGYNIGAILVYPLQFIPSEKKLIFNSKIEIEISYKDSKESPISFSKRTDIAETVLQNTVTEMVKNATDIPKYLTRGNKENSQLPDEEHLYVIITSNTLESCFQPLLDWKLKKGLSATLVTTTWIYSEYTGVDGSEQIRNFIKDAYQNWGTLWVLLGGDINKVPYRTAFAFDCETTNYDDNWIPCDLYFSDLDGDWNANGNDIYGEVDDNIDMYPDVFVGRATVNNIDEADAFVDKILTYEKEPSGDYQLDMLFLAMILWWDPYTDAGLAKNHIDDMYVPDRFDPITKLYQSIGNLNHENAINSLNEGQILVNHDGHAWWSVMSIGNGSLTRSDMDALTNGPDYSILFTIGCWPAAFDYDCIAEHFITNPNGGGVAFVGNSRYGWGSPGNPLYGYSDRFDLEFYHQIFGNNIYQIGNTLSATKSTFVPLSGEGNVYRWCEYELNLLGEPEMPIWTDIPGEFVVTYPEELPLGNSFCQITVTNGTYPIEGALVCLMKDEDVYETAITGIDGQVDFQISTINPADDINLTVTAHNFIPYETTISLISDEPYIQIKSYTTNGSEEGYVIPGELTYMDVWLHNYGNENANDVSVLLTTDNIKVTMIDSAETITSIDAGDSIFIENAFTFEVSEDIINGEVIFLTSEISDGESHNWTDLISIIGTTPLISYFYHDIIDAIYGNGNGIAEPGEIVNPHIIIKNSGLCNAEDVTATLSSNSPYIDIPYCIWNFGDIYPSQFADTFAEIAINPSCPTPLFPQLDIAIYTENGYVFSDSFFVTIGETGFWDDMENGEDNWTHSGTDDLWHLTPNRKLSGDYSWYCGIEGQFIHNNNMEDILVSESFTIGQNAELSFWCWYEFTNYGTDGFYVEVNDGSGWTVFDFIGSGGALGILPTGNDWLEYKYDLSQYPPGTTITIRFRFVSDDGEVAEGVYIDDVKIYEKDDIIVTDFSGDVTSGTMPLTVQFTDVSNSSIGSIVGWFWEFGDGETSDEQNPIHIYELQGRKTISLTVTDEFGFISTKTKINYIDVATGGGYVVYVNPDGTGDFTNLHDGIEATYDGDTLLVADGFYLGNQNKNISFDGKNIVIISEQGPDNCIIDCENTGFIFMLGNNDSLTIINGLTIKNTYSISSGSAIDCSFSNARIENCIFENCVSEADGGAIFGLNSSGLTITGCQFITCNSSNGGAIYCSEYDDFLLENCSFDSNSADISAGIYIDSNISSLIQNCNFYNGNSAGYSGAIFITGCESTSITECDISNNFAQNGGGMYLMSSNVIEIKNVTITNNEVTQYGGGIYLSEVEPIIENCIISSNIANRGAGIFLAVSNPQFINCLIIYNSAVGTASIGGGVYSNTSIPGFSNCTISNNSAEYYAGGIFVYSSTVNVNNSIFWGDTPQEIYPPSANLIAEYSNIQGSWTGTGNIAIDPQFVDPINMDFHFQDISPCIDTGLNDYVTVECDLDGNVRIWDGDGNGNAIVDMGCYEFGAPLVSVDDETEPQIVSKIYQNYPNPFSTSTTISFSTRHRGILQKDGGQAMNTEINIYNVKGQLVKQLSIVNSKSSIDWDGKDDNGHCLGSGIYFIKLMTEKGVNVEKMVKIGR